MEIVEWSDDYKIGEAEIDKEHWGLFALINDLREKHSSGSSQNSVAATIIALINYVEVHFEHEERLMEEISYPDIEKHKKAHQSLNLRIREFEGSFMTDPDSFNYDDFFEFLTNWLKLHILKMDMELAEFHKSQQ